MSRQPAEGVLLEPCHVCHAGFALEIAACLPHSFLVPSHLEGCHYPSHGSSCIAVMFCWDGTPPICLRPHGMVETPHNVDFLFFPSIFCLHGSTQQADQCPCTHRTTWPLSLNHHHRTLIMPLCLHSMNHNLCQAAPQQH